MQTMDKEKNLNFCPFWGDLWYIQIPKGMFNLIKPQRDV